MPRPPLIRFLLLALLATVTDARGTEEYYFSSRRIDGLPLIAANNITAQLLPAREDDQKIDLVPFFSSLGIAFKPGMTADYLTGTSMLVVRGDDHLHAAVDGILNHEVFDIEHVLAISETYLRALETLKPEARITFLLTNGFFPSPIVAAHVRTYKKVCDATTLPDYQKRKDAIRETLLKSLQIALNDIREQIEIAPNKRSDQK